MIILLCVYLSSKLKTLKNTKKWKTNSVTVH